MIRFVQYHAPWGHTTMKRPNVASPVLSALIKVNRVELNAARVPWSLVDLALRLGSVHEVLPIARNVVRQESITTTQLACVVAVDTVSINQTRVVSRACYVALEKQPERRKLCLARNAETNAVPDNSSRSKENVNRVQEVPIVLKAFKHPARLVQLVEQRPM